MLKIPGKMGNWLVKTMMGKLKLLYVILLLKLKKSHEIYRALECSSLLSMVLDEGFKLVKSVKAVNSRWISRTLFVEMSFLLIDVIFRIFLAFSFPAYFRTG